MTLAGVETQQFPQAVSTITHDRKQVTAAEPSDDRTDKSRDRADQLVGSPTQDQVTLSKEAQALSVSNSQRPNNNSFQQSPSPFDK